MVVLPLEWDSAFFGLRIGKVIVGTVEELEELQNAKERLREQYDLVYVFITDSDLYWEEQDAFLVDRKIVYAQHLAGRYRFSDNVHAYQENLPDEALYRLALRSGTYSRFKTDPSFPEGKFEALYRRWMEQSVEDRRGVVLCYYDADAIVGMMTLVIDDGSESARIGLTAVDAAYSGQGVGSSLMETACAYLCGRGIEHFETVTQVQNVPACRWYEKNGFQVETVTNIFHWWLNHQNHEDSF